MVRRLFAMMVIILASCSANAATPVQTYIKGNELRTLFQDCGPDCQYYVAGLADAIEMVSIRLTNICRPSPTNLAQMVDVLVKWLDDNPAERHRPAAKLAGLAFAEAWPAVSDVPHFVGPPMQTQTAQSADGTAGRSSAADTSPVDGEWMHCATPLQAARIFVQGTTMVV